MAWDLVNAARKALMFKVGIAAEPAPTTPPPTSTGDDMPLDQKLKAWTITAAYELVTITYDTTITSVVKTATVKWPDDSAGVYTAMTIDGTWKEPNSWKVTHLDSGATITQPAVTRNSGGYITNKPPLVITGI